MLRVLIIQLLVVQSVIETFRVLAVFDCSYNPQSYRAYSLDVLTTLSFLLALWPIIILLRIDYHRLRKFNCIKKFLLFKITISVSKFLSKILSFLSKRGLIHGYKDLGATQRSLCEFDSK